MKFRNLMLAMTSLIIFSMRKVYVLMLILSAMCIFNACSSNYETSGEAIDLGLPSGIKWASCNIGATVPEEFGDYYGWGEIEEKDDYSGIDYKWGNLVKDAPLTKYCTDSNHGTVDNKTTLELKDDVAHIKWGGKWRMPTETEIDELRYNCNWEWINVNGVEGYKVTGLNGNSIFLPAAGGCFGEKNSHRGSVGLYWSASLCDYNESASSLRFYNGYQLSESVPRNIGLSVRPVTK